MHRYRILAPASAALAALLTLTAGLANETSRRDFSAAQKKWWSLQPVSRPAVPAVKHSEWGRTPVGAFIASKLEAKGIAPGAPADRVTLLRRATVDLTGLMPTPEETQAFLNDQSPEAFARVVDRLLESKHYGERWARHWLDLARYADSEGFKSDETRPNVWRYRDYVIRAFNDDKPYNRFIQEQIAGDEMFPGNVDALVATGFNRHFPDEYNARNLMQRRQELLNDVTDTVGSVFMGLTYGCARCHDHKFDPILHKDYYRLQSFFASTHSEDTVHLSPESERATHAARLADWESRTAAIRAEMSKITAGPLKTLYQDEFDKYPPEVQDSITAEPGKRTPFQWQMYYQSRILLKFTEADASKKLKGADAKRYAELKRQLAAFDSLKPGELPIAQTMIETGTPATRTHVLRAGAWDAPLEEVQPGFLSILDPSNASIVPPPAAGKTGRRTALARWLTDPSNPLVARVMANRVWHYHFGRGIAGTPSDFGLMGERPTHPELLDYLASRLVENGWSVKKLHREIMLSAPYQQSSQHRAEAARIDPSNKLLWHYNRRRIEGESLRDSMLQVAGMLNTKMYGPGTFPPLPAGVVTRGGWKSTDDQQEAARRSIYIFVRRNTRYPMFEAFDMPDSHESCSRRNTTVTPTQALELMNSELVMDWSRAFAQRVLNDPGLTTDAQVDRAYRLAFSRPATESERTSARQFLERHTPIMEARLAADAGDAGASKVPLPAVIPAGLSKAQAAAMVDLCHTLFNSNEFLTLN
ncbi:MAG: DUF1553 domain-containing protein [Acidobacteria bacterium]|nr:DUF1553 domain-containing protein [Acidobacteriota bacterium]